MRFPVTLTNVVHKNGGTITRIAGIAHEAAKPQYGRSQDVWFFRGDVTWGDGSKSKNIEIAPYAVCYSGDESRDEVNALMLAMNEYLAKHGEWCDRSSKHEGWYANERPTAKRRAA